MTLSFLCFLLVQICHYSAAEKNVCHCSQNDCSKYELRKECVSMCVSVKMELHELGFLCLLLFQGFCYSSPEKNVCHFLKYIVLIVQNTGPKHEISNFQFTIERSSLCYLQSGPYSSNF